MTLTDPHHLISLYIFNFWVFLHIFRVGETRVFDFSTEVSTVSSTVNE